MKKKQNEQNKKETTKQSLEVDFSKLVNETSTWEDGLETGKNSQIVPSYLNHVLLWENHPIFENSTMRYNEFLRQVEIDGEPMKSVTRAILRTKFEICAKFHAVQKTDDFIDAYSYKFKYNPVADYLNSVVNKLNDNIKCRDAFIKWFDVKYEGELERKIIEELTEKWFVSAIKRIFEPGCAVEGMIVIVGKTGTGKSTFINRLAKGYAVEAAFNIEDERKSAETLNRCWICNFDEFKSLQNKDPQVVKEYLTKTTETTRLAFRRDAEEYARHCVFISSTNDSNILKDYTGNEERRFWVFQSQLTDNHKIYNDFNDDIVDALWADAMNIYLNNKNYNISRSDFTQDEMLLFIKMQRNFKTFMQDDAMDLVRELLNRKYVLNNYGEFNTLEEFKEQVISPIPTATDTLNRIPISWINVVMQTLYHTSRKNDKIAAAMNDEFIYRKVLCSGGNCVCLIRKGTENIRYTIFNEGDVIL